MRAFAALLERLVFTPARGAKLRLIARYFAATPDPDRGWALAALAGTLRLPQVTPARIRALVETRVDPVLFRLSYDFVGDLAETVALIWPETGRDDPPRLAEVVAALQSAPATRAGPLLAAFCDRMAASERLALIKLAGGATRVGVSARLARTALAEWSGRDLDRIEELWSALTPPYTALFAWAEGAAEPQVDLSLSFRPMMLAHPIEDDRFATLDPADYAAEWKWDGIRVQAIALSGQRRLYSRTGEDLAAAFPDVVGALDRPGVADGELLVIRDGTVAPFGDLQQRLGRKAPTAAMIAAYPARLRLYDLLHDGTRDLRPLPWAERRAALEVWGAGLDLSPLVPFASWEDLAARRDVARAAGIEGLMLKHRAAPYTGGRPVGPWFKWKRDPLSADCVLVYAQRGHGKRSSFYSDYTFACWRDGAAGPELVPVGKAYSGFTDAELARLDAWVRANTTERFGPVRAVRPELVLEIAFDGVQASTRHKSGVAMRFPRVHRIRWDKPAAEADRVDRLVAMIPGG